MRYFLLAVLAVTLAACNSATDSISCTQEARPGISVTVLDSATIVAAGRSSRILAHDGIFADSVPSQWTAASDGPFGLVYERTGTYTVTVTRAGYRDWTKSGIVVTKDRCHVRTVPVTALLQK